MLEKNDDDWPVVQQAINGAQMVWSCLQKLLTKADPKTMTSIYKAMVQEVLLYGAESWVLTGTMEKTFQSFHNNVQDT
jgi:hypothetical protein